MKYSNVYLCDDNFDYEYEKLCDRLGLPYSTENNWYSSLPLGFRKEKMGDTDIDEYIKSSTLPDVAGGCSQAIMSGEVAYEFGNMFISLKYECVL